MEIQFKNNGEVVLVLNDGNEITFHSVSSCLNYCKENGLDPTIGDCK